MKGTPYIGITGFINPKQVEETTNMFEKAKLPDDYTAMFGILTGPKHWKAGKQNDRFPDAKNIEKVLEAVPNWALPTIHYCDGYERDFPRDPIALLKPLYDKGICKGVQLNMTRPTVSGVDALKEAMPDLQIVYQLSQSESKQQRIEEVVSATKEYDSCVDYVLIDPSGGAGLAFDNSHGLNLMNALSAKMNATIGIAGGLSGNNVYEKVTNIQEEYKDPFFIDAEGQLLTPKGLDMQAVESYVQESCKVFK
jgi:phosphoribosylanthranilate isomerase